MKPSWTLRQVLALLRGIALMAHCSGAYPLQLVPSLVRGGLAGVHDHIARVLSQAFLRKLDIAISRMYLPRPTSLSGCVLFLVQRYLGRKLASQGRTRDAPETRALYFLLAAAAAFAPAGRVPVSRR